MLIIKKGETGKEYSQGDAYLNMEVAEAAWPNFKTFFERFKNHPTLGPGSVEDSAAYPGAADHCLDCFLGRRCWFCLLFKTRFAPFKLHVTFGLHLESKVSGRTCVSCGGTWGRYILIGSRTAAFQNVKDTLWHLCQTYGKYFEKPTTQL